MATYFGFYPSKKLKTKIEEARVIINEQRSVSYYTYRNEITHLIADEMLKNLLHDLVDIIPNNERKKLMRKIASMISATVDSLINRILNEDSNEKVLPSFQFLEQHSIFYDPEADELDSASDSSHAIETTQKDAMRIGFALSDADAQTIYSGFRAARRTPPSHEAVQQSLNVITAQCLQHFLHDFTQTLGLGKFKRTAIPIAQTAILKGVDIGINKLLPQLPPESLVRLVTHFEQFVVDVDTPGKQEVY